MLSTSTLQSIFETSMHMKANISVHSASRQISPFRRVDQDSQKKALEFFSLDRKEIKSPLEKFEARTPDFPSY